MKLGPVLFQNHTTHLEIVMTWCYRKPFHIIIVNIRNKRALLQAIMYWFSGRLKAMIRLGTKCRYFEKKLI